MRFIRFKTLERVVGLAMLGALLNGCGDDQVLYGSRKIGNHYYEFREYVTRDSHTHELIKISLDSTQGILYFDANNTKKLDCSGDYAQKFNPKEGTWGERINYENPEFPSYDSAFQADFKLFFDDVHKPDSTVFKNP
jgi:hypothetical protein